MNELSQTIRTFNRFELKYLLTLQQAEHFKSALRPFMIPDNHGYSKGRYSLSSLYYDSPDYRCYWEKVDGLLVRRKLRLRHYEDSAIFSDETPVFVEIKQRVDRVTQKRRVILPYCEALRLCNDRQIPEHAPEDRAVIEEIYAFVWQYNLSPASLVRYDRQAFVGTDYDPGLRVTFDTSLTFQVHPLHLHEPSYGLLMLPPNQVVLEIKVNERIPNWLADMIAKFNLKLIRTSKYCLSIEAARNMPAIQWRSVIPENAQEVLSSSLSIFNKLEEKMGIRR